MTVDEALDLVRKCIAELGVRFLINQKAFMVKIVDASGVREVEL
jgi:20S proteasome subunit beta 4